MTTPLGTHCFGSIEELIAYYQALGKPVNCDPALVPVEYADEECDLADELERRGVPVVPSASKRKQRLAQALRKAQRTR